MKASASHDFVPIPALDALVRLGRRINQRRRAVLLTQADLASKARISLSTLNAIENGAPTVQMGYYMAVLFALDAHEGLDGVASLHTSPEVIDRLTEDLLPKRVRR